MHKGTVWTKWKYFSVKTGDTFCNHCAMNGYNFTPACNNQIKGLMLWNLNSFDYSPEYHLCELQHIPKTQNPKP
jgi:hypothetical protein